MWAEVGTSLRNDAALDDRPAVIEWFTAAAEDAQPAAEAPRRAIRTCEVLDGGSSLGDGSTQNGADAPMQQPYFASRERVGRPQWVDTGSVQGLIDVDVPEAG